MSPARTLSLSAAFAAGCQALPASARVNPKRFLDQFESSFGKFDGYRRSAAKGLCAVGEFVGSDEGREPSAASAFCGRPVAVIVRF